MLQRKKLRRTCGAFTLIEVSLAAAVLLFAIVGAFQLVAAGARMLDFSRKQTIATQIIHAEIDQMHISDWSTVKNWADNNASVKIQLNKITSSYIDINRLFGYPELMTFQGAISASTTATGFSIQRDVSYVSGRTDMVTIVFTVTWTAKVFSEQNGAGHTYTRQGTTYVGKNGLAATYQRS